MGKRERKRKKNKPNKQKRNLQFNKPNKGKIIKNATKYSNIIGDYIIWLMFVFLIWVVGWEIAFKVVDGDGNVFFSNINEAILWFTLFNFNITISDKYPITSIKRFILFRILFSLFLAVAAITLNGNDFIGGKYTLISLVSALLFYMFMMFSSNNNKNNGE